MQATIGDRIFALVMVALLGAVLFIMLGGLVIPQFNVIIQNMMIVAVYAVLGGMVVFLTYTMVHFAWIAIRGKW